MKKTNLRLTAILGISTLVLGFAHQALAAPVYSANFENPSYTTGDIDSQNGWSASDKFDVLAGGLGYTNGVVSEPGGSQALQITGTSGSNTMNVGFTAQTDTVYFGLTLNYSLLTFYQFGITDSASTENIAGFKLTATSFNLRSKGASQQESGGVAYTGGDTVRLVMSLSKDASTNYNTLNLYVNPSSTTLPGSPTRSLVNDIGIASVDQIYARIGGTNFPSGSTFTMDNLRVGSTYADVVAVPEPSTFAMLLLSGLGMLFMLRRRR